MTRTTLSIDGMMCGMCESHINDAIRNNLIIKKVLSSHKSGKTVIESEERPDEEKLKKVIADTGYELTEIASEEFTKKRFSLFGG